MALSLGLERNQIKPTTKEITNPTNNASIIL